MERSFLFLVTQLRPHPNPLPKGVGVCLNLGTLPRQAQVRISIHLRYNLQPAGTFGPNLFEPPA